MTRYGREVPLPLAPLVAALVGVAFALLGRDEIRRSTIPPSSTRAFLVVTLTSVLLLAPALAYFVGCYPDWAYAYLVPGERVPSAVDLLEIAAITLVPSASFAWAAGALRRHAVRELVRGAGALVVLLAGAIALLGPRLLLAGTWNAWHEGIDLAPLSGSSLGVSILWVDGCLLAGLVWAAARVRAIPRA